MITTSARSRLLAIISPAIFALVASAAHAEPFVVTTGAFTFAWEDGANVNVSGPAFSIHNTDSNPEEFGVPGLAVESADPFAPMLPLGGHIIPAASGGFTLTDGTLDSIGSLFFDLTFEADSALSRRTSVPGFPGDPTCVDSCLRISATGPFRLSGQLTFVDGFSNLIFERELTGTGIATVGFTERFGGLRPFAVYEFGSPVPTPEPSAMLLLTSGGFALLRRMRCRGRKCGRERS